MKKAIGLALAVLVTAVVAASAQGAQKALRRPRRPASTARARSRSPFVTPVTGGAGFLGAEQGQLGEVRGQDARASRSV